jgi:hypothetical protein
MGVKVWPGEYTLTEPIVITKDVPMIIDLSACKINLGAGVTGFRIRQGGKGVTLVGGWFVGGNPVEFNVTDRAHWIGNWRVENAETAIRLVNDLHPNGAFWTEGCKVEDGIIQNAQIGIEFVIDSPAHPSFMETILRNIHISNVGTGIYIPQDASVVRSRFDHLTMWVRDNQTGIFIDGLIRQSIWSVFFEHKGPANGAQCIEVGSNFAAVDPIMTQWMYDIQIGRTGSWANIVNDPDSKLSWRHVGT